MKSFMNYIEEEINESKQTHKVYQDGKKADVMYYHDSPYLGFEIIGHCGLLGAVSMACPELFYKLTEGGVFYDGNLWTYMVGTCLFMIGFCLALMLAWYEWTNERYYMVDNDSTEAVYSADPRLTEILPKGARFKVHRQDFFETGMVLINYKRKQMYINIKELKDITIYKEEIQ